MIYNFKRITGPRESQRKNFEELVCQLLALELDAKSIDGAGGDGGIDCFRELEQGLEVFQAKYFLERLTSGQRAQISRSLRRALEIQGLRRWVLCMPLDYTTGELEWFGTLAPEGVSIAWWGETKLRSLISKHPTLASEFFAEDQLELRFRELENQVRDFLRAAKLQSRSRSRRGDVLQYLDRAQRFAEVLRVDQALLDLPTCATIAVDFSEIYTYMHEDASLAWAQPVVDYCVEESPFSLALLPPSVFECAKFLDSLERRLRSVESSRGRPAKALSKMLADFVDAFERSPDSDETWRAYRKLGRSLGGREMHPGVVVLRKLQKIIDSGKLIMPDWPVDASHESINPILNRLGQRARIHRRVANIVDAATLVLVRRAWVKNPDSIRLLSSVDSMHFAAQGLFGKATPVRSSSQYACFVHAAQRADFVGTPLSGWAKSLKVEAKGLAKWVELGFSGFSQSERMRALDSFSSFAPCYRDLLKPVDDMVAASISVLPKMKWLEMEELHHFLVSEARVADGFHSWWEQVSQTVSTLRQSIVLGEDEEKIDRLYSELEEASAQ